MASRINFRDLTYVVAVADTRHFGRAADLCRVSQPTLSGQIRKLEEALRVTLFERDSKSVAVTAVGQRIVQIARTILEAERTIRDVAASEGRPLSSTLRIGVIPTLAPYLAPLALAALRRAYPDLRIVLVEELTVSLERRLATFDLDGALVATAPRATTGSVEFACLPIMDEPFYLVGPDADPALDAVSEQRPCLPMDNLLLLADGHCLRDQALTLCRTLAGPQFLEQDPNLSAASLETVLRLVAAGYGRTLVPALAVEGPRLAGLGLRAVPIPLAEACRRVLLVFRKTYPRTSDLVLLARTVRAALPDTVTVLEEG